MLGTHSTCRWQRADLNLALSEGPLMVPLDHVIPLVLWTLMRRKSKVDLMAWCSPILFTPCPALAL